MDNNISMLFNVIGYYQWEKPMVWGSLIFQETSIYQLFNNLGVETIVITIMNNG
jgi:hypothetical protein